MCRMDGETHPKVERAELGKTKELYLDFANPPQAYPPYGTVTGRYHSNFPTQAMGRSLRKGNEIHIDLETIEQRILVDSNDDT